MTINQLIQQVVTEGGAIVSSGDCTEMEIADARARGRFSVRDDGMGFVRRSKEWLALQLTREKAHPNIDGKYLQLARKKAEMAGDLLSANRKLEAELDLGMETMAKAESTIYMLIRHRGMLERALIMLKNASLQYKMDKDDLEIEDANAALAAVSESQREAAESADDKQDGQAENVPAVAPATLDSALPKDVMAG